MTDSKRLSRQRYDKFAQEYVYSESHAKGDDLDRLVAIAQPQATWHVLDIATGGGHTALKFAPHVAHVIASDLTPKMLDAAREFIIRQGVTNVAFKQADAEDLPFADGTFDLVTCRIAPHHFPDAARFVREVARVLKTGGLFLMQDHVLSEDSEAMHYADHFEKVRDPSHNRAYNESEWRAMFTDAGLAVEYTEQLTKRHTLIPWARRQGHDDAFIEHLRGLLRDAPDRAFAWMQPQDIESPDASFVNHHLIIAGRK